MHHDFKRKLGLVVDTDVLWEEQIYITLTNALQTLRARGIFPTTDENEDGSTNLVPAHNRLGLCILRRMAGGRGRRTNSKALEIQLNTSWTEAILANSFVTVQDILERRLIIRIRTSMSSFASFEMI